MTNWHEGGTEPTHATDEKQERGKIGIPFTLTCCCLWRGHSEWAEMWSKDLQLRSWAGSGHLSLASGICTQEMQPLESPTFWSHTNNLAIIKYYIFLKNQLSKSKWIKPKGLLKLCIFLCTNDRFCYLLLSICAMHSGLIHYTPLASLIFSFCSSLVPSPIQIVYPSK